jgi:hypothetical protein
LRCRLSKFDKTFNEEKRHSKQMIDGKALLYRAVWEMRMEKIKWAMTI